MRCVRITPESRKICGYRKNLLALTRIQVPTIVLTLAFIVLFCFSERTKLFIPVRFQRCCDKTIIGIHAEKAVPRQNSVRL